MVVVKVLPYRDTCYSDETDEIVGDGVLEGGDGVFDEDAGDGVSDDDSVDTNSDVGEFCGAGSTISGSLMVFLAYDRKLAFATSVPNRNL
ncbi:hypothetical protein QE152_g23504 [Popillia japonica]|uniref:Uncharacterized protein n=1 Tax=Popillia japonica TaxID=7064 RepID=A0AAW1KGV3_POPJA